MASVSTRPRNGASTAVKGREEAGQYRTSDYDKFQFMTANRDVSRQYVNSLKQALQAHPEIMEMQPLLCNENLFIIDGQHRFTAAVELGMPITYAVVPGIGIEVARAMNILQRSWGPRDFAKSYAIGNNKHYQAYIKAQDDYELGHNILMAYLTQKKIHGANKGFRQGLFEVEDVAKGREFLDRLLEIKENIPFVLTTPFAFALLKCFTNPVFKYDRFIDKLKKHGNMVLHRSTSEDDYLRMIEEIYNYNMGEKGRTRLF